MTTGQNQRFQMLRSGPCVTLDYVRDYYGLAWPLSASGASSFEGYARTLRRASPVLMGTCPAMNWKGSCRGTMFSRKNGWARV